jgi:uncharacterized iron-regulated membrane protein
MTFRKTIFWAHLAAGLISGISIGIMCFTGAALAFEKEITAFSERDARSVTPPSPDAPRLPIAELQARLRTAQPEVRPSGFTLINNPTAAVAFTVGRNESYYVNPYTGEVRQPASTKVHDFLHVLEDWHRVLAMGGDNRAIGKAINGACNLAFFVLAVTGLYLWWPRKWRTKGLRRSLVIIPSASGKARDWNWHNVIGLWSSPVLIVLTLTAIPISYRWGANLIYTLTGTEQPAAPAQARGGPGVGAPAVEVPTPAPGTTPLSQDQLIAAAQKHAPNWTAITLRAPGGGGRGASAGAAARSQIENQKSRISNSAPAFTVSLRESTSWPRTANTTLSLNPYTGDLLKRTGYADMNAAQRLRSWTRFLHTGEALGWAGQFFAGLACLGGCVLVYTGFALSWRRFFFKKPPAPTPASG